MKINKKIRILFVFIIMLTFIVPLTYARTKSNIDYNFYNKYVIVTDGQTYKVPSTVSYSDNYNQDLANYHDRLTTLRGLTFDKSTKDLTFTNVFNASISGEYIPIVSIRGIKEPSIDMDKVEKLFGKNSLLQHKINVYNEWAEEYNNTQDAQKREDLNTRMTNYNEDIEYLRNLDVSDIPTPKTIYCAIPYLTETISSSTQLDSANKTLSEDIDVNYYLYSIIYRDLRIFKLEYSVNSGENVRVPNFDKDKYTYNIDLPATTPKDATIKTTSNLYMNAVFDSNDITDYQLDLNVEEANVKLSNGKATAQVKVKFDKSIYPGAESATSTERIYTINFSIPDFLKGDMNKDGIVDPIDASIALDKYKYSDATDEDLRRGDMDNNGIIDPIDASMILDVYKGV